MLEVDESRDQRIRERAHQLWESAGSPSGREEEFWLRAEAEIRAEPAPATLKQSSKPAANKRRPA